MVGLGQRTLDCLGELGAGWSVVAGLVELGNRLRKASLRPQDKAEVVVGVGVVWLQPDRHAEFGDRLLEFPQVLRALPRL